MICANVIAHYGAEWIRFAVQSVINQVDKVYVFYTSVPTHGHGTTLRCPETLNDIQLELSKVSTTSKVELIDITAKHFPFEGAHRDYANNYIHDTTGADVILVLDADELWDEKVLANCLKLALATNYKIYRINMKHYFRSLYYYCEDSAMPVRIVRMNKDASGDNYMPGYVYHMGYAQTSKIVRYKLSIHGHKGELRPEYFDNVFMPWKPGTGDVHPTSGNGYWNPKRVSADDQYALSNICGDHKFWIYQVIP